jgi:hypothetical protein
VRISQGGHNLLLLIGTHATAEQFWKLSTPSGSVLVQGADLVRTAEASLLGSGSHQTALLTLTGDTKASGPIRIWGPAPVLAASWDGYQLALSHHRDGSVSAMLSGPPSISVPALTNWRFSYEAPERLLDYNDSSWPVADHMSTTNPTKPVTLPVLYADDYGFHHGFIWYRGHFTATSATTGITLTGDGGQYGAFSVWLNGAFLGSNTSGGEQQQTFSFPSGALHVGGANVVSVLVESMGHNEDGVYGPAPSDSQKRPRGLLGAAFTTSGGAAAPAVTWRLEGNKGGTNLQDPTTGVMNPAGLYGTNHGWELPGYPTGSWSKVSLPSSFATAGLPPGIGWYRTTFNLNLPKGVWAPMGLKLSPIHGGKPGGGKGEWQAFIYLNGWMVGRYINYLGPQQVFYLPQGILNVNGANTLAIATWSLEPGAGGLGNVSLVPYTVREGGIPISNVAACGPQPPAPGPQPPTCFNAATYGMPVRPSNPVLSLSAAIPLAQSGKAVAMAATLSNQGGSALVQPRVSLTLPAGWTSAPATASVPTLPPGQSATVHFSVTPEGTLTPGPVDVVATASFAGPSPGKALATATLFVPEPNLAATYDNVGISLPDDPSAANFDGSNYSFPEPALEAVGAGPGNAVSVGGLSYTMPNVAAGAADNTLSDGQVIAASGQGNTLGFLEASGGVGGGGNLSGTGTVYYSDGTSSQFSVNFGNYYYAANNGNVPAIVVPYLDNPSGQLKHTSYIFAYQVAIDPAKTVVAVRLPAVGDQNVAGPGAAHVFSFAVGNAARPAALSSLYDNIGISNNTDPGTANYDGYQSSYSAQTLAAAGLTPGATVSAGGLSFTWPDVAAGKDDNVVADGQAVSLSGQGSVLGFLGAGTTTGGSVTGNVTVTYTDGSTVTEPLTFGGFYVGPASSNTVVASLPYFNGIVSGSPPNAVLGQINHTVGVYLATVTIDPTKTVASVTLPPISPSVVGRVVGMHIFAVAVGS